jgi:hypothetical protein
VRARERPRLPRSIASHGRGARDPALIAGLLDAAAPLDLVAGPSGYGLPLTAARDLTDIDLRLAYLAADGEAGGIGGLRALMRLLARSSTPVVLTPGVVHLPSVPAHRKVNRVDMGTADKVCAAALAVRAQADRRGCRERDVSFILLELGGAFTAALAVDHGSIVDGAGGSSGWASARRALDGESRFRRLGLEDLLFRGRRDDRRIPGASAEPLAHRRATAGVSRGTPTPKRREDGTPSPSRHRMRAGDAVRTAGPVAGVRDELTDGLP